MKKLCVKAEKDRLDEVLSFVNEEIDAAGSDVKPRRQINMAVEEIFLNVSSYAYEDGDGDVEISIDIEEASGIMSIVFEDQGMPFDPLSKEDPDIHQPGRERRPGGLGIMMVKKTMDEMHYEYRDKKNILTLKKCLYEQAPSQSS